MLAVGFGVRRGSYKAWMVRTLSARLDMAVSPQMRLDLEELAAEAGVGLSVLVRAVLGDFIDRQGVNRSLLDDLDLEEAIAAARRRDAE